MELAEKLSLLAASARYDASCASSGSARPAMGGGLGAGAPAGVCHSFAGDGRCISLLKVLYSNACRNDCAYCANRASADVPRATFGSEELVDLVLAFYRRNFIEGLFLSSGLFADPDLVMDRLIEVARVLRERERFGGYIHLKAIPGCGDERLRLAGAYADRLSANIELPTASSLSLLAPEKSGREILGAMRCMGEAEAEFAEEGRRRKRAPRFAPAGQSTQIVVGASPESDRTIISLAAALYRRFGLRRVYYSAFLPVAPDPRIPATAAPPLLREHRLYQSDWLIRFYGFKPEEIIEDGDPNLPEDMDPKTAWALRHPERFPVDVLRGGREELLRVPGIGVTGARRIIDARRIAAIRPEDLPRLGIVMKRARHFLSIEGRPLARPSDSSELRRALSDLSSDSPAPRGITSTRPVDSRGSSAQLEFELP